MAYPKRPEQERFWKLVAMADRASCWEWLGPKDWDGYGLFRRNTTTSARAHRLSYEFLIGPIPDGLVIDHLCRNRACMNPAHMEPVTNGTNVLRGYSGSAKNARKTHCKRGHPLSGENLRVNGNAGERICRICQRNRSLKHFRLHHAKGKFIRRTDFALGDQ